MFRSFRFGFRFMSAFRLTSAAGYILLLLVFVIGMPFTYAQDAPQATFVVNTTTDAVDTNIGDGSCAISGGGCSLRAAIDEANSSGNTDTIQFNIAGSLPIQMEATISGGSYPMITEPVTLDGTTQPGYTAGNPVIEINDGLVITGGLSTVRGLSIKTLTLQNVGANIVQGNLICVRSNGTTPYSSTSDGILITTSGLNIIGGSLANLSERNVISGCALTGIVVQNDSNLNVIRGNLIGTNKAGTAAVPNGYGVSINGGSLNTVGGTAAERNIISGNTDNGVGMSGEENSILNNYIGLDITGLNDLGNGDYGVSIGGVPGPVDITVRYNVISGNGVSGITVSNLNTGLIDGNIVGLNAFQTAAMGNERDGIQLANSTSTGVTISNNIVAGNGRDGVQATGNNHLLFDNLIGVTIGVNGVGNGGDGLLITGNNNTVTQQAENTWVAYSGEVGILITSGTNNKVQKTSTFENGGMALNLGPIIEVTPNDNDDPDTGANGYQNFPVITSTSWAGGVVTVNGRLNSKPSSTYTIDVYANRDCDSTGYGEGEFYLGQTTVNTDANGDGEFSFSMSASYYVFTATATGTEGTSEYSKCFFGGPDLLTNGNFDDNNDANVNLPDGWKKAETMRGDKLVTNTGQKTVARSTPNAFQFAGFSGESGSKLSRKFAVNGNTFLVADGLRFSAFVKRQSGIAGTVVGKATVKYTSGSPLSLPIKLPAGSASGWVQIKSPRKLPKWNKAVEIVVQLYYNKTSGKFTIDDVQLQLEFVPNAALSAMSGGLDGRQSRTAPVSPALIPMPDAPNTNPLRSFTIPPRSF